MNKLSDSEAYDYWVRNINHMKMEEMANFFKVSIGTFRLRINRELHKKKEQLKRIKTL